MTSPNKPSPPREFRISPYCYKTGRKINVHAFGRAYEYQHGRDAIHVIEKSAYLKAVDCLRKIVNASIGDPSRMAEVHALDARDCLRELGEL